MLEHQVERVIRLLKALDGADGDEDYVIHREPALAYVQGELSKIDAGAELSPDDISKAELQTSLESLQASPPQFKRKSNEEVLAIVMETKRDLALARQKQ